MNPLIGLFAMKHEVYSGSCASPLIVGLGAQKLHAMMIKCHHCQLFNAIEVCPADQGEAHECAL